MWILLDETPQHLGICIEDGGIRRPGSRYSDEVLKRQSWYKEVDLGTCSYSGEGTVYKWRSWAHGVRQNIFFMCSWAENCGSCGRLPLQDCFWKKNKQDSDLTCAKGFNQHKRIFGCLGLCENGYRQFFSKCLQLSENLLGMRVPFVSQRQIVGGRHQVKCLRRLYHLTHH